MEMKRKIVISMIFALFVAGSLLTGPHKPTANAQSFKEAPDFTLPDLSGNSFKFSNLKGKVIILDFWATWCPPYRAEIPHFKSLYSQYKSDGLEVIGIALDQGGVNVVKPFAEDFEINYPILIGNQRVTDDYGGIRGIPTTFIINRSGDIVKKFVGYQDKEVFESAIQDLL